MTERTTSSQPVSILRWCLRNPVETVGALLTILLSVIVFLQVFLRYAFHSPLAWSEEFAMFLFQWFNFLGAAIAVRRAAHFQVDLITGRLPARWRAAIQIWGGIIILVVAYLMIHMGVKMALSSMDYMYSALEFPIGYAYLAIPISGVLMIIFQIPIFVRQIVALRKG
jgi:TRAP-type transport system small permease protein